MLSILFRRGASAAGARSFSTTARRDLARISIIGNIADTPQTQTLSNGREVVRYSIASNSGSKDNRQTSWFRVTSFAEGSRRDYMLSLPKGSSLYVDGDVTMNQYQDVNGQQRTSFNVTQRMVDPSLTSSLSNIGAGFVEVLRRPQAPGQNGEAVGEQGDESRE